MSQVGILTETQKEQLTGQAYAADSFFNPIQDANDTWVISQEEMDQCVNENFMWVKDLTLIEYVAKPTPSMFE